MSIFAGPNPESLGWYKVYEWTQFNDVPTFIYDVNNSSTAPVFSRVLYQLVFGAYSVWCEFDDFTSGDATRVGVPLSWVYDVNITNLRVAYSANSVGYPQSAAGTISNRSAATGKINYWSSNYGVGPDSSYNENDSGYGSTNGFGSFQVFDTTVSPAVCVFAWNDWGAGGNFGFGNNTSNNNIDWTFNSNRANVPPKLGRAFVK